MLLLLIPIGTRRLSIAAIAFCFERYHRAFEQNNAAEADRIYGDTFAAAGTCVEGIGNNISFEFEEMGFSGGGISRLVVYGRSPIDKNTIHIRFAGLEGETNQIIEFTQSDGYEERVFELDRVTGDQKVTFIFLPGSQFDFGWFRFEK